MSNPINTPKTTQEPTPSPPKTPKPKPPSKKYNYRGCPSVKRLLQEAAELSEPTPDYSAHPIDDNLFEWHFTIRGPSDSEFENGIYHGRIEFPPEYPMQPPAFSFFTENGRFAIGQKICLSISDYHPETWLPSWSIRTALLAIISFMTSPGNKGNIGELNYPIQDRKILAMRSLDWTCPVCGPNKNLLADKPEAISEGKTDVTSSLDLSLKTQSLTDTNSVYFSTLTIQTEDDNQNLDDNSGSRGQTESNIVEGEEMISNCNNNVNQNVKAGPGSTGGEETNQTLENNSRRMDLISTESNAIEITGLTMAIAQAVVQRDAESEGNHLRNLVLDFAIGFIVTVIFGLFCRRLLSVFPNLGFGLF